jgi:hypothetical protein
MHVTQDLNSFGEIIAHAQCSVDENIYIGSLGHYCGDRLTFGCFVPMIADHNLLKKSFGPMIANHDLVKKR